MPAVEPQFPWHHVHVTMAERQRAASWYEQYLGATLKTPTPRSENLMYGPNLMQFQGDAVAGPLTGSRLLSLGFTVPSVATITGLTNVRAVQASGTVLATDPFGMQLELTVGDTFAQTHLNIAADAPDELADWYHTHFGGEACTCDFDPQRRGLAWDTYRIYFLPMQATPTDNRCIDHIGWYTTNLDAEYQALIDSGVDFAVPPRDFGAVRLAFARDPTGIWIELVEPPNGKVPKPVC
ncbi:MAG: VOC family protein [Pseudomonadota bacterium]